MSSRKGVGLIFIEKLSGLIMLILGIITAYYSVKSLKYVGFFGYITMTMGIAITLMGDSSQQVFSGNRYI